MKHSSISAGTTGGHAKPNLQIGETVCSPTFFRSDSFECELFRGGYVLGRIFDVKRFANNLDQVLTEFFEKCWPMVEIAKTMPLVKELEGQRNSVGIDEEDRPSLYISFWNPRLAVDAHVTESNFRNTSHRFVRPAR